MCSPVLAGFRLNNVSLVGSRARRLSRGRKERKRERHSLAVTPTPVTQCPPSVAELIESETPPLIDTPPPPLPNAVHTLIEKSFHLRNVMWPLCSSPRCFGGQNNLFRISFPILFFLCASNRLVSKSRLFLFCYFPRLLPS